MTNPKIKEMFLIEAGELIVELEEQLMVIEETPDDHDLINSIFRAIHTIKGSAGLTEISEISSFAHMMENVFERLRVGEIPVSRDLISASLKCIDVLKEMVDKVATDQPIEHISGIEDATLMMSCFLIDTSSEMQKDSTPEKDVIIHSKKRTFEILFKLNETVFEVGLDPVMLIYEMQDLGKIEMVSTDISDLPKFEKMNPEKLYLNWRIILTTEEQRNRIQDVFLFVADDSDITITDITADYQNGILLSDADKKIGELLVEEGHIKKSDVENVVSHQQRVGTLLVENGYISEHELATTLDRQQKARQKQSSSSIRVEVDKLDKLMNLVGELVTGVSQVSQIGKLASQTLMLGNSPLEDQFSEATETLDRITRDLREQVMQIRMVPVEGMFNRYKRIVRDLADSLGKKARLSMSGTETELDKNVIDILADPLKHIVRNCIDHGIEFPEQRTAKGKSPTGTIQLSAKQQEGSILIEIEDDGKGIDKNSILNMAIEKGLADPMMSYSDSRIYSFIFEPGFSTAKAVTDISGRGVGMDVVKKNIDKLGGTVDVESQLERGTKVTMKIPLTLAIIEGMTVQVGEEVLTIPLLSIVEQIKPDQASLKTLEGKGELVDVRGECLPLIRLHSLLGFDTEVTNPTDALVVVMEGDIGKYGLLVDNILGQQQAVIKSIEKNFQKVEGVAGATILGNGNISLILDPYRIEKMAFQQQNQSNH